MECLHGNAITTLGKKGVLKLLPKENAIQLPSGLSMYYNKLKMELDEEGREQYSYKTRMGYIKIYGGKVIEFFNLTVKRSVRNLFISLLAVLIAYIANFYLVYN